MTNWAIRLTLDHRYRAGELRSAYGVEAAVDGDVLWLKGDALDAEMQCVLAPISDGPVYQLAGDGRLTPFGNAVPTARLPDLVWRPLEEVLKPVLPIAQMAVVKLPRVALTLVRSSIVQQERLLVTDWLSFLGWAVSAPEIRLHACQFAVEETIRHGRHSDLAKSLRVIVQGHPLPPLAGNRYWLAGHVAVPLGFHWSPAVDVATLNTSVLGVDTADSGADRIWIWNQDTGKMDEIAASAMIPVTRANVRGTEVPF